MYHAQELNPARNDWHSVVKSDKEEYKIDLSDEEILQMSKNKYKKYIESQINKKSYNELTSSQKSKVSRIIESMHTTMNVQGKIPIQGYLKTHKLSTEMKKLLFSLRCREYDLKVNYKSMYENNMQCRICEEEDSIEDERHTFFECERLVDRKNLVLNHKVEHIFGELEEQISVMNHIIEITSKRDILIKLHSS